MARTLLRGWRVFDAVTGSPTLAPADVVIESGRIVEVGLDLDGDDAVDLAGKTVLPGFIDCHVHVVLSTIDLIHSVEQPFSYQFFEAARNLRTLLRTGITTIRDAWGADLGVKKAVEDGLVSGPRMQIAVTMVSQTGGHADPWFPSGQSASIFSSPHPGRPFGVVDGPEAMRTRVREIIRAGADVIKVATSGGVLSPGSDPRHRQLQDDELAVLVAEARAAGLPVMAHAQATEGVKAAVRAGARSIEHGIFLDDEAIGLMLTRGTWLVPTLLAPFGVRQAVDEGMALSEASKHKLAEIVEAHVDSFRRAVAAGVKVAMGTDCPVAAHGRNLEELALMVRCGGMTSAQALVAATSSAAALLGLAEEIGTIEPGKRADLVVLDGDLGDLPDVQGVVDRVEQVWQDGRQVV